MPLLDLGGEKDVTIDDDVYTLRRVVSWTARQRCKSQMLYYVKRRDIDAGLDSIKDDDLVPMTIDTDEDVLMLRLETWLVRWSHTNPDGSLVRITRKNLERLPSTHVSFLMNEIRALEREQDGPEDGSPLPDDSND